MQDARDTRYSRQMRLSAIGEDGQRAIAHGTAVVIGLGALGCTSANILARAGVGAFACRRDRRPRARRRRHSDP